MIEQDLRETRTDEELNEWAIKLHDRIIANRQAGEVDAIITDAVHMQVAIDTLHARALGECEGCAVTAAGEWTHRLDCATLFTPRGAAARALLFG